MEIGQQLIHDLEPVPRIDEQVGGAVAWPQGAAVPRRLQRAHHGGPYRHHRAAFAPRRRHRQCSLLGYRVTLPVHHVVLDPRAANGREGVGSHVQRHLRHHDPALPEPPQQLGREVQSGGGRGRGAGMLGVHRLVALGIGGVRGPVDVGRQRHRAMPLQVCRIDRAIEGQQHRAVPVRRRRHRCRQAIRERHRVAAVAGEPARAPGERPPAGAAAGGIQEQKRHFPPPVQATGETRMQHPGVVQHHDAARRQPCRQLAYPRMVQRARRPLQYHEPRRAALRCRPLRDQLPRQLKTEPAGPHRVDSGTARRRVGARGAGTRVRSPSGRARCAAGIRAESGMARTRLPGYLPPR